jgi:signal transduction histidine kinase
LGLAVARGIVEQHGGTIFFTDSEIGGATAVIDLPR